MLKILFADDSMTAQNMGKKILTDAGYDVIAVSNGAAAAKKILEQPPDIAILDVHMPGYTGFEVCAKIRAAHETAKMPVLLTVGKMEPYSVEDGARVKADGVIIKPFEASVLLATVRNLAERLGPPPSESGNFGTMRIPVPSFEEYRDESYAAWKAETTEMEVVDQPTVLPSVAVPPAMANAPAYGFDETIAIPPPAAPPVRETVEMESLPATHEVRPNIPSAHAAPLSVEETQPIHPYVDPYEEDVLHTSPVHVAPEPEVRQEFTAVFASPAEDSVEVRPAPAAVSIPEIMQAPAIQSPAASVSAAPPAAAVQAPPPDFGALETFEESKDSLHIQREPELELTSYASEDIVITPDPSFEHTAVRSTQHEVPTGTAPGLVTSGAEALEISAPAMSASGAANNSIESAAAPGQPETHDAAFEKLVSELLAREPASAVSDSPEAASATQEKPPQSFFSKYLGFGRTNRPPGTGSYPRAEESSLEPSQEIEDEATPIVPTPAASASPADELRMDFESTRGSKPSAAKEAKIPETKLPIPPSAVLPVEHRNTEAGIFVGTRDFKTAKPGGPPASSIPFTASAFRDEELVKPRKEAAGLEDLGKPPAAETAVAPFSASFKEETTKLRKEPKGFEDLGTTTLPEPPPVPQEVRRETHAFETLSLDPSILPEAPVVSPAEEVRVEKPVAATEPVITKETVASLPVTPAPVTPAKVVIHDLAAVEEPVVQKTPVAAVAEPAAPAVVAEPVKQEVVPQISTVAAELPQAAPARAEVSYAAPTAAPLPIEPAKIEIEPETQHEHAAIAEPVVSPEPAVSEQSLVPEEPEVPAAAVSAEPAVVAEESFAIPAAAAAAIPDHSHMMDTELAQQLAAALEHHAQQVQHVEHEMSGAAMNGQPSASSSIETAALPAQAGIGPDSVSLIITRVLDRMVPEIIRLITVELETQRTKRD